MKGQSRKLDIEAEAELSPDHVVKKLLVLWLVIKRRQIGLINNNNVKQDTHMLENHGACLNKWPVGK